WWHFQVEGVTSGKEIRLHLELGEPAVQGISPQICFSYDHDLWGLTDTGKPGQIGEKEAFVYRHVTKGSKIWCAYDIPYTPHQVDALIEKVKKDDVVAVFELCKTRKNRTVNALRITGSNGTARNHGIWLQARAHAFESGA